MDDLMRVQGQTGHPLSSFDPEQSCITSSTFTQEHVGGHGGLIYYDENTPPKMGL